MRYTKYYKTKTKESVLVLDGRITQHKKNNKEVGNEPDKPDTILHKTEDELIALGFRKQTETN